MWWSADMIYTDLRRFVPPSPNNTSNGGGGGGSDPNQNQSPDYLSLGGNKISEAMRHCYKGFLERIPPTFCYKKNADFGKIPTDCPPNYFRSLAMCYENCKSGYYYWGGVCYENCKAGYANHPLSCFKNIFDFYFKGSYVPN